MASDEASPGTERPAADERGATDGPPKVVINPPPRPLPEPPKDNILFRFWNWLFPELKSATDRVVRRLVVANLLLLLIASAAAHQWIVVFVAILAASGVGAIGGLLFGVPKRIATTVEAASSNRAARLGIVANTSLGDVSDWLTKTIVGVGLVSWPTILERLDGAGAKVGGALVSPQLGLAASGVPARAQAGANIAATGSQTIIQVEPGLVVAGGVGLLLASSTFAALASYLWFARHLPREMIHSERDALEAYQDLVKQGLVQEKVDVAPTNPDLPRGAGAGSGPNGGPSGAGTGGGPAGGPGPAPTPGPAGAEPEKPADDGEMPEGAGPKEPQAAGPEAVAPELGELAGAPGERAVPIAEPPSMQQKLLAAAHAKYALMRTKPLWLADWAKGMFGGASSYSSATASRQLRATVKKIDEDWFEISFEVLASPRPETEAIFFLHNTFPNPTPSSAFDESGIARLTIAGYGAFTAGVLLDDGSTELELDLAGLKSAPAAFRRR